MLQLRFGLLAGLLLAVQISCLPKHSSQFVPPSDEGLVVLVRDSHFVVAHAGEERRVGAFYGGLVEVVSDNPRARRYAETARRRTITGYVGAVLGAVCAGGLIGWDMRTEESTPGWLPYTLGGCSLALLGGILVHRSGDPYVWDAINTYNYDLRAPRGASGARAGSER